MAVVKISKFSFLNSNRPSRKQRKRKLDSGLKETFQQRTSDTFSEFTKTPRKVFGSIKKEVEFVQNAKEKRKPTKIYFIMLAIFIVFFAGLIFVRFILPNIS